MKPIRLFLYICLATFLLYPASLSGHGTDRQLRTAVAADSTDFIELSKEDYPIAEGKLPYYHAQIPMGKDKGASFKVRIEYPEFAPLTATERNALKALQDEIPEGLPTVETYYSTSRGEGWLEFRFCPIVSREGRPMRLVSCKITVVPQEEVDAATGAKRERQKAASVQGRYSSHSVLASGKWVKIRVKEEGIYELTNSQLASLGFKDPSKVKLYGYGGLIQEEALQFSGEKKVCDDLQEVPMHRRESSMIFFAEGTIRWTLENGRWVHQQNPYSQYSYYFLTEGDSPATIETLPSANGTNAVSSIMHHALLDDDKFSWYEGGREFYDPYDFQNGNTHTFQLSAPNAEASAGNTVYIAFSAASSTSSTQVEVSLAGNTLGKFTIPAYGDREYARESRQTFSTGDIASENAFKFTTTQGNAARLNYIRVTYSRKLSATDAPYSFSPTGYGSQVLHIADANANTRLWQIGITDNPLAEVPARLNGTTLEATVANPSRRFVIVDIAASYPAPEIVGEIENQDLHADAALDMIIMVPASGKLTQEAERLAEEHRQKQGLRVKVVPVDKIYNEFSSGTPDATAYRRYMKMLYDRAETSDDMPKYLLLFGDCLWDNRMVTGSGNGTTPDDYLLSYERSSSETTIGTVTCYVTDDYYGLLEDGKGANIIREKVDIGIGRFTCNTAAEAKIYVDKTIKYMENSNTGVWKNTVYILGDDGDDNEHMEDAEAAASQMSRADYGGSLTIKKIYWDAYPRTVLPTGTRYPQVTKLVQEAMKKGALLFNYSGHGSPDQISHSKILLTEDFGEPTNGMPLWVFASCEIAPYDNQNASIARTAMLNENGGAVAIMCASRAVYADRNGLLNRAFSKYVLGKGSDNKPYTMGEAMRLAKVDMLALNQDLTTNKLKYLLIGDPAVPLAIPTRKVLLDSINGEFVSTQTYKQLKAGQIVRFSGYVTTEDGLVDTSFNGSVTATITDRQETIVCKKNDSQTDAPMEYTDRSKTIYEGSNSVSNGRFSITILIPRDISYTDDSGRITFYAVNTEQTLEANGYNEQFCLNGTDENAPVDNQQPEVFVYLNTPDFPNGGFTDSNPTFIADIQDDCGISTTGSSVGHDMELVIDGDASNTYTVNNYFSYDFGSYNKGTVTFPLQNLSQGKHSLSFKVWDVNNNSTTAVLDFTVKNGAKTFDINATSNPARTTTRIITSFENNDEEHTVVTEIYDIAGRLIWSDKQNTVPGNGYSSTEWLLTDNSGAPVPAGIYLYRAKVSSNSWKANSETKKIIVVRQ